MYQIDARGKPCPQPVLLTKEAAERGEKRFEVLVDNEGAAQNVLRFIQNAGYAGEITGASPVWRVSAHRSADQRPATMPAPAPIINCNSGTAALRTLIIQAEHLGSGSMELGSKIMAQFLNTLAVSERRPEYIVLMNTGARLACTGSEMIEPLRDLQEKGVSILVCGTCLNYFDLNDKLEVGRPSNAYEVLNLMLDGGVMTWG